MGQLLNRSLAALGLASLSLAALGDPVTIGTPFINLENDGVNSDGFSVGKFLRIGANSAVPNGDHGTIAYGETTDLVTGQDIIRPIFFTPSPLLPNFYQRRLDDRPSRYGPWTLNFVNGADRSTAVVTLPAGTTQAPFVNSVSLSGTSANPTFTWAPPAGATVNGYRIQIYDKALISATNTGLVASRNVTPDVTSATVLPSDFTVPGYAFKLGNHYSIEIDIIQTRNGTSGNLGNSNLAAISRAYADFTPNAGGGPPVNLPVTLVDGTFLYNVAVVPGQTYYIDPDVATGYDYRIGAGDPDFKSVVLPTGIGDGLYDIYALGPGGTTTLLAHDWEGGKEFDFAGDGASAFRVTGIETSAGLNPSDATAFATGLTFEAAGVFTGTQTPLVSSTSAVPESPSACLLLLGTALAGLAARRQRPRPGSHALTALTAGT